MHLFVELVSSYLFWADVLLSIVGGLIVYWGLRVEKSAEKFMPPTDFKPDLFGDILEAQKRKLERGWRILMTGIVIEVVAALLISIISGLEMADLNDKAQSAEQQAGAAKERAAMTESNNLALRSKVLELEAKSRWRTITPEQKSAFINLTRNNVLKLPIRVRMADNANAEAESYGNKIRELLDAAGFVETNKDSAITHWPAGSNILWTGDGPELPPIVFLNNISTLGKPVDMLNAQKILKTYPGYSTNAIVRTEFVFAYDNSESEAYVSDSNGVPILHLKFTDRAPFQISGLQSVQSAFRAIGIQSAWMTSTNIPDGICEIFVNPK